MVNGHPHCPGNYINGGLHIPLRPGLFRPADEPTGLGPMEGRNASEPFIIKEIIMNIHTTFEVIESILYGNTHGMAQELVTNGHENLLDAGNKAYYRGGGWWYISSYSSRDMPKTIALLKKRGVNV